MIYDLTNNLILLRPVMKGKFIRHCKEVLDYKHMGLFLEFQGMWAWGFCAIRFLREDLLVLNVCRIYWFSMYYVQASYKMSK